MANENDDDDDNVIHTPEGSITVAHRIPGQGQHSGIWQKKTAQQHLSEAAQQPQG